MQKDNQSNRLSLAPIGLAITTLLLAGCVSVKTPGASVDVGENGINVDASGAGVSVGENGINVNAGGANVNVGTNGIKVDVGNNTNTQVDTYNDKNNAIVNVTTRDNDAKITTGGKASAGIITVDNKKVDTSVSVQHSNSGNLKYYTSKDKDGGLVKKGYNQVGTLMYYYSENSTNGEVIEKKFNDAGTLIYFHSKDPDGAITEKEFNNAGALTKYKSIDVNGEIIEKTY